MSTKMEGYAGSVATNTTLSVDTVATNKHFHILMKIYNLLILF